MYTPNPFYTGDITLTKDLINLTELLAENIHNVWADSRIKEGWRYGKIRSNILKTLPSLIPYALLPESEKKYDRCTALETLKMVIKLGYTIEKR